MELDGVLPLAERPIAFADLDGRIAPTPFFCLPTRITGRAGARMRFHACMN